MLRYCVKADGVIGDKVVVQPVVFDHQLQYAVKERNIAPRLDRQKEIAGAGNRGNTRINDDDLGTMFARLPDIIGSDRCTLSHIGSTNPDHLRAQDVAPGIGGAVNAKGFFVARRRAHHTKATVVVDVRRFEAHVSKLAHQIGLLGGQAGAAQQGKGVGAMLRLNTLNLRGDAVDGLVIVQCLEAAGRAGIARIGMEQAVGMGTLEIALHPFGAQFALIKGKVVTRFKADYLVCFDFEQNTALLTAKAAVRRHQLVRLDAGVQPQAGRVSGRRAKGVIDRIGCKKLIVHCYLNRIDKA